MHTASGCFAAVWHICTHGDCHVAYVPGEALLECPCHGSRFGEDGRVLRGPATRPLQAFPVGRVGDSLWLHRPR
jgi:Rieske Fe-S protein